MRVRDLAEWAALVGASAAVVLGARELALAHRTAPPPLHVEVPAPPPPPNPTIWARGDAQAHALVMADGLACWTEGDGSVRMARVGPDHAQVTTFPAELATVGPVLAPSAREACWFSSSDRLRCGTPPAGDRPARAVDVATANGSALKMAADGAGVVWTQFDGVVAGVTRGLGRAGAPRTLAKLHDPLDVVLDGDTAWVLALDPLRIVGLSRSGGSAAPLLFEQPHAGHLGTMLADPDALYVDTRDDRDGYARVLRVAKRDGAVTTLYRGFAHVALTALHGKTLYGLEASAEGDELDLENAVVLTLPVSGGALARVRTPADEVRPSADLVVGWGGSVATDGAAVYYTHGPRNPVGAPGPIWRLLLR
jgi:hypothetical protein